MTHDRLENPMVLDGWWRDIERPRRDAMPHCRGGFDPEESLCRDCPESVDCADSLAIPLPPEWPRCTECGGVCTPDECGWVGCAERAVEGYEEDAVGERDGETDG